VLFTDDVRCPIHVTDLAAALLELAASSHAGIHHVAGADAVSRLEFARLVCAANRRDPARVRAGAHPRDRPGDCALDCSRARGLLRTRLRGVREVLGGRA
jgi:dTDP-4-dehydrorhamnose reductase